MKKKKPASKKSKTRKKAAKAKPTRKAKKKKREYHHYNADVTEEELIAPLDEELKDAWLKIKDFAQTLGPQRIYASHRSIMFSKKVCYFFVRPQKKYLEVVFFHPRKIEGLKSMPAAKKIEKYFNVFKLTHEDQVEEPLTDWLREAYEYAPEKEQTG